MWAELRGKWGYVAGAAGTPVLPAGAQVIRIIAHGTAGTLTINAGDSIPVVGSFAVDLKHLLLVKPALIFTSTDSYYVEYVTP